MPFRNVSMCFNKIGQVKHTGKSKGNVNKLSLKNKELKIQNFQNIQIFALEYFLPKNICSIYINDEFLIF